MNGEPALLARDDGFGAVALCSHGCVHVQIGSITLTLTESQYQRFVAMLTDSAADFEMRRAGRTQAGDEDSGSRASEGDFLECP